MASEPGFYPEFSVFFAVFAQELIPTKVNIDADRARQARANQHLIPQISSLDACEKY